MDIIKWYRCQTSEINDLNYYEFNNEIDNSDYDGPLFPLLHLSLEKLSDKDKVKSYKIGK